MAYNLSKYEKETVILYNQSNDRVNITTYDPVLRRKLTDFAAKHPDLCRRLDKGKYPDYVEYEIDKENCSCPAGNPRLAEGRRLKIMARRRANGEGSIRKRSDGSWEGRITIGYDPFGKQVMKSVYGRTQRDVKEKLERLKADLEGKSAEQAVQSDSDSGKDKTEVIGKEAENTGDGICMLTLEQWLDIWRKQYLSNVKPGTVCHYESVCRLHIVPALGNIPLVKLRTPAIQKFYIDLQEKGLSPKYIKNIHGCLHKALDIAVRIDYM